MNKFSQNSLNELSTALPILQKAAHIVLRIKDHSVLKGFRGQDEQNAAFYAGYSKAKWPNGRHNKQPSHAIDVRTWPEPPENPLVRKYPDLPDEVMAALREQPLREEQYYLMGLYRAVLAMLGWYSRTGADWDDDGEISDTRFRDLFHVEVYGEIEDEEGGTTEG